MGLNPKQREIVVENVESWPHKLKSPELLERLNKLAEDVLNAQEAKQQSGEASFRATKA